MPKRSAEPAGHGGTFTLRAGKHRPKDHNTVATMPWKGPRSPQSRWLGETRCVKRKTHTIIPAARTSSDEGGDGDTFVGPAWFQVRYHLCGVGEKCFCFSYNFVRFYFTVVLGVGDGVTPSSVQGSFASDGT